MGEPFRKIVVEGRSFRWRFVDVLVVIPAETSGPQLYVDWGWKDWLDSNADGGEPKVVTPRFVAEAIRFAISQDWPSRGNASALRLTYRGGCFRKAAIDSSED